MISRNSRNRLRHWGKQGLRLLFVVLLLDSFTSQPSCVLSFTCNSQQKPISHHGHLVPETSSGFKGGVEGFTRDSSSLGATLVEKSRVGDTTSQSCDAAAPSLTSTRIVFPGGGIFFYYQAGLVNFLREGYDLSSCTFSGASAGALTATLTAADVDFFEATELALKLAADAGVWDRTGGLQGIWGPMIEEWLNELLPASIEPLQDRITLLVTPVPSFGKTKVSRFKDKKDLIKCNMASVHLVSDILIAFDIIGFEEIVTISRSLNPLNFLHRFFFMCSLTK